METGERSTDLVWVMHVLSSKFWICIRNILWWGPEAAMLLPLWVCWCLRSCKDWGLVIATRIDQNLGFCTPKCGLFHLWSGMETTGTVTSSPDFFCLLALLLFLFVAFKKQQSWFISWRLSSRFAAAALWPGTALCSVPESPGHSKTPRVSWLPSSQPQLREPKNSGVYM